MKTKKEVTDLLDAITGTIEGILKSNGVRIVYGGGEDSDGNSIIMLEHVEPYESGDLSVMAMQITNPDYT